MAAIHAIGDIAERAGVPLAALAIQFSTRDPRIASTVIGVSKPERVEQNVAAATISIDPGVFDEIDAVVDHLPTELLPN